MGLYPFWVEGKLPYDSRAVIKQRIIEILQLKQLEKAMKHVDGGLAERLGMHSPGRNGRDLELWREFLGKGAGPSTGRDVCIPTGGRKESTKPIPEGGFGSFDISEDDIN